MRVDRGDGERIGHTRANAQRVGRRIVVVQRVGQNAGRGVELHRAIGAAVAVEGAGDQRPTADVERRRVAAIRVANGQRRARGRGAGNRIVARANARLHQRRTRRRRNDRRKVIGAGDRKRHRLRGRRPMRVDRGDGERIGHTRANAQRVGRRIVVVQRVGQNAGRGVELHRAIGAAVAVEGAGDQRPTADRRTTPCRR